MRTLIWDRCKGRCEWCFLPLLGQVHFHHRNPRRMGGSRDPLLGSAANGVALHPDCHEAIEQRRSAAQRLGFILYAEDDPTTVPIMLQDGWALLDADGGVTYLSAA